MKILIIPSIALTLTVIFYIYFLRKSTNKSEYNFLLFIIFIFAFILNFTWELLQGPAYFDYNYDIKHISFCALASIADAIMVLMLYFALSFIYKNEFWIRKFSLKRILLIMLIGGIGAILSEARHINAGSWIYADSMPILPYTNVGIYPVLQFMLLPSLIYFLAGNLLKARNGHTKIKI